MCLQSWDGDGRKCKYFLFVLLLLFRAERNGKDAESSVKRRAEADQENAIGHVTGGQKWRNRYQTHRWAYIYRRGHPRELDTGYRGGLCENSPRCGVGVRCHC